MYGLGELLFGVVANPAGVFGAVTGVLGLLLMCGALFLLGRRDERGWLLAAGAFAALGVWTMLGQLAFPLGSPTSLLMLLAATAVILLLTVGTAVYGLLAFRKLPADGAHTRAVMLRSFTYPDVLGPLAVAVLYAAATLLGSASLYVSFSAPLPGTEVLPALIQGILAGLLPAALVGLAHRSRWAWLLILAVSVLGVYNATLWARGSVVIFLYVILAGLAFHGWQRWAQSAPTSPTSPFKR